MVDAALESSSNSESTLPASRPPKARRAILEWFLRREALAQARSRASHVTDAQRELVRRARLAFELGEHALAPENALPSGSATPIAAELFREAVYWTLLASCPALGRPTAQTLWASVDQAVLLEAAGGQELSVLAPLMDLGFADFAEQSPAEQSMAAEQLKQLASRLLVAAQRPVWDLEELKFQRLGRGVLALVFVVVCALAITMGIGRLLTKPNLAMGKPWSLSSEMAKCHPEDEECGGTATKIFFHTNQEDNPWIEYDLGQPIRFSSMTIVNRADFQDRAVPLVVEVSNDRKDYAEVARRTEVFGTWKPKFPSQHARYLRLRVLRRTWLHLEAVEVHP